MKKFVLFAIVALLVSAPAFAADSSSTVIKAVIAQDLTITGGLPTVPTTLPLSGGTTTIGTLTVNSNLATAWTITISSTGGAGANKGVMKASGVTEVYPYTVTLKTAGATVLTGSLGNGTTATPLSKTDVLTGVATVTYTLEVTTSAVTTFSPALPAGTYEDTITITIAPNA